MSTTTARRLCLTLAALYLAYGLALTLLAHPGLPTALDTHTVWPWLADKPVGEDGFYMLTVARNLAATGHLTYNFALPTTGIQPLATFVFAAIAWVSLHLGGNEWTLIRAILFFGVLLSLAFSAGLAAFTAGFASPERRPLVFILAFALTLLDVTSFRLFTYGLETGVYLCTLLLCLVLWRRIVTPRGASWPNILTLGLAAGLAGLARIDFGLLFAILLTWLLFRRLASLAQVLVCGTIALVALSPWLLYVHAQTGGWMPSSGTAESDLHWNGLDHLYGWFYGVMAHLVPWSYASSATLAGTLLAYLGLAFLLTLAWRSRARIRAFLAIPTHRDTLLPWAVATTALTALYLVFFVSVWFFPRYFAPLLLVTLPAIALLLAAQTSTARRYPAILTALLFVFAATQYVTLHRGRLGNPRVLTTTYVQATFPTTRVGAFQSGILGYLDPNVENLDGKLNLPALREHASGHLDRLLDTDRIDVLIDLPQYITGAFPRAYLDANWQPCPHPPSTADLCLIRRTYLARHPELR